jgi:hypothetical protein
VGKEAYYNCGEFPQTYETSFGPVSIKRHMYQNSDGGKRICPLEEKK